MSGGFVGSPKPGSPRSAILAQSQSIRLLRADPLTLTDGANTDIPWTSEDYKNGITHDVAVNAEDITIVTSGRYLIVGQAALALSGAASDATPRFNFGLNVVGSSQAIASAATPLLSGGIIFADGAAWSQHLHDILDLVAGDVLTFYARVDQAAGSPILVASGAGSTLVSWVAMHRLS